MYMQGIFQTLSNRQNLATHGILLKIKCVDVKVWFSYVTSIETKEKKKPDFYICIVNLHDYDF